jgi:D-amino peptidase
MTEEVNAVVAGLVETGVEEILVNDSHGPMVNILPDLLHPEADLILGKPKPMNMACGLTGGFDAMFLIGHHSMANKGGILAHTTNGFAFREVRVNGTPYGEPGLYGAYAGELGVPVALVSGDDCTERENRDFFPEAEFVVVKQAIGRNAARQASVQKARNLLREGAKRAVERLDEMRPFCLDGPYLAEFVMNNAGLADQMAVLPPARRVDAVTMGFECKTVREVIGWMTALSAMSAALR